GLRDLAGEDPRCDADGASAAGVPGRDPVAGAKRKQDAGRAALSTSDQRTRRLDLVGASRDRAGVRDAQGSAALPILKCLSTVRYGKDEPVISDRIADPDIRIVLAHLKNHLEPPSG